MPTIISLMTCRECEASLPLYLAKGLPLADAARALVHLTICADCRALRDLYAPLVAELEELGCTERLLAWAREERGTYRLLGELFPASFNWSAAPRPAARPTSPSRRGRRAPPP